MTATAHHSAAAAPRIAVVLLAWVGWAALAIGCRGTSDDGNRRPPALPAPLSAAESERGIEACAAYRDRVCQCAESMPDADAAGREVADQCQFAKAKHSSLTMVLEVNRQPKDAAERAKTNDTARRIIASCIEGHGRLAALGCHSGAGRVPVP